MSKPIKQKKAAQIKKFAGLFFEKTKKR